MNKCGFLVIEKAIHVDKGINFRQKNKGKKDFGILLPFFVERYRLFDGESMVSDDSLNTGRTKRQANQIRSYHITSLLNDGGHY